MPNRDGLIEKEPTLEPDSKEIQTVASSEQLDEDAIRELEIKTLISETASGLVYKLNQKKYGSKNEVEEARDEAIAKMTISDLPQDLVTNKLREDEALLEPLKEEIRKSIVVERCVDVDEDEDTDDIEELEGDDKKDKKSVKPKKKAEKPAEKDRAEKKQSVPDDKEKEKKHEHELGWRLEESTDVYDLGELLDPNQFRYFEAIQERNRNEKFLSAKDRRFMALIERLLKSEINLGNVKPLEREPEGKYMYERLPEEKKE